MVSEVLGVNEEVVGSAEAPLEQSVEQPKKSDEEVVASLDELIKEHSRIDNDKMDVEDRRKKNADLIAQIDAGVNGIKGVIAKTENELGDLHGTLATMFRVKEGTKITDSMIDNDNVIGAQIREGNDKISRVEANKAELLAKRNELMAKDEELSAKLVDYTNLLNDVRAKIDEHPDNV